MENSLELENLRGLERYDQWQSDLPLHASVKFSPASRSKAANVLGAFLPKNFKARSMSKKPVVIKATSECERVIANLTHERLLEIISWNSPETYLVYETKLLSRDERNKRLTELTPSQLLQNGYSVLSRGLERSSRLVREISHQFSREFGCYVRANAYVTPPNAQTLRRHWDSHDVFLLQTHGTKRWKISQPLHELPLSGGEGEERPTVLDVTISPGEILYIPHGFQHEGISNDEISSHVTFGLFTVSQVDLLPSLYREVSRHASHVTRFRERVVPSRETANDVFANMQAMIEPGVIDTIIALQTIVKLGEEPLEASPRPAADFYQGTDRACVLIAYPRREQLRLFVGAREFRFHLGYLAAMKKIMNGEKVTELPTRELDALLNLLWSESLIELPAELPAKKRVLPPTPRQKSKAGTERDSGSKRPRPKTARKKSRP